MTLTVGYAPAKNAESRAEVRKTSLTRPCTRKAPRPQQEGADLSRIGGST